MNRTLAASGLPELPPDPFPSLEPAWPEPDSEPDLPDPVPLSPPRLPEPEPV